MVGLGLVKMKEWNNCRSNKEVAMQRGRKSFHNFAIQKIATIRNNLTNTK